MLLGLEIYTYISYFEFFPFRYADKISVRNEVLVEGYGEFMSAKVIDVSMLTMPGKYHGPVKWLIR